MSVISIKDIWKTYRTGAIEFTALKGVSLDISKGEFTVIMGPSGSGKSTLMNIIGCLDRFDEGTYILNGSDVRTLDDEELAGFRNKEIGFVFQSFNLLSKLTILENVELSMVYARVPRKERRQRALKAIETVGLLPWKDHKPSEISGGQKQRVAIARAIVNKPSIILADEPTGNLDSKSAKDIMDLLTSLNLEGTTVVLITHDPGMKKYAKRLIEIFDGEISSNSKYEGGEDNAV